jgi:hypothetical protein
MAMQSPVSRPSRSGPLPVALAVAFGVGLLATVGFATFGRADAPAAARPAAGSAPSSEGERLAAELTELRERNAAARAELDTASSALDRVVDDRRAAGEAEPEAQQPSPRPRTKKPPRPRRPQPESTTQSHPPIPVDDDRDPLAGIRK